MKKIYNRPQIMVIQLATKSVVLQMSISSKEIEEADAGFTREFNNNSTISNKSVWEEEW